MSDEPRAGGAFASSTTPLAVGPVETSLLKRNLIHVALALALAFLASSATAQTARLSVLADSLSIGEPFEVAVAVDHAPGQSVVFPEAPAELPEVEPNRRAGDAEILSVRRLPPTARGAIRTDSAIVTAAVFVVDSARVGPIRVQVATGADTMLVEARSVSIPVRSVLSGEATPEPSSLGPVATFPSPVPVLVGLGVLAAVFILGFIWILIRLLRKPTPLTPRALPYPEALTRLDALAKITPTTPEATETHFDAIRDTLRTYLARRLGLPVYESTTSELTTLLVADGRVPEAGLKAVRGVLRLTDLVAFAGFRPAADAATDARAKAREAIETIETALRELEKVDDDASPPDAPTEAPVADTESRPTQPA